MLDAQGRAGVTKIVDSPSHSSASRLNLTGNSHATRFGAGKSAGCVDDVTESDAHQSRSHGPLEQWQGSGRFRIRKCSDADKLPGRPVRPAKRNDCHAKARVGHVL